MERPHRVASTTAMTAMTVIAIAASLSSTTVTAVEYCTNTVSTVLTTCGPDDCQQEDRTCVQYPAKGSSKCSDAARNECAAPSSGASSGCTIQCLEVYNPIASKWTLFVKEPKPSDTFLNTTSGTKPTDKFPAAPVEEISADFKFPEEIKKIQITGFDDVNVQKGSTKKVKLDASIFDQASVVQSLALVNIDLSKLSSNFLPKSVSALVMENCALSDFPSDIGSMGNLKSLNLAKNSIAAMPTDNRITTAMQSLTALDLRSNELSSYELVFPELTTLDLSENKLTAFPPAIFNLTKLTSLKLNGNAITSLTVTSAQFNFLKRLEASDSSLGIAAAPGSCASGQKEEKALDTVVCVSDSAGTTAPTSSDAGSSSNTLLIVCVALGVALVLGGLAFLFYRRRNKAKSQFYNSVMENQTAVSSDNRSRGTGYGGGHAQSASGRASMQQASGRASMQQASGRASIMNGGGGTGRSSAVSTSGPAAGLGRNGRAPSMGARASLAGSNKSGISALNGAGTGTYAEIGRYQEDLLRESNVSAGLTGSTAPGPRQRERAQIHQNVHRIASQDILYTRTIAKGAFGEVWLASYGRDLVAVKKLLSRDPASVGDFIAELNLLASLSHPRVLSLIGACWDDEYMDLQIVTEYMDSGDLLTVLRKQSPTDFTWENGKTDYCLQICEAVFYLHSLQPALIHRDIKSRNILIDSRKGAKLSDFGESRERTIQNTMTAGVGTARWVAPEIILGEDYSELADIYSLGVLLTELDTHMIPFENMGLEEHMIVQQVAVGKLRPKVSESCPEVIRRLTHECLQFDPHMRPSAARVLQTLMASPLVRRLSTLSDRDE